MLKVSLFSLAFVLLTLGAAVSAQANTADAATQYVEGIAKQALATISNGKLSKQKKQQSLEKLFSGSVDITWVARFVMGRFWRQATDAQKKAYLKEYEKFLLQHYTSRFADYSSGSYEITGTQDDGENEYTVSMSMQGDKKGDPPVLVDYRVRYENGKFQIFDVIVEGVSMITTQRSEFASVISRHDIDYLIEQLKNKSIPITNGKK